MIYVWLIAGLLLVGGALAAAIVKVRRQLDAALFSIRARQRAVAEQIAKIEAALSDKAPAAEARNLAAMVDGVASICHRLEARLSALEGGNRDEPPGT